MSIPEAQAFQDLQASVRKYQLARSRTMSACLQNPVLAQAVLRKRNPVHEQQAQAALNAYVQDYSQLEKSPMGNIYPVVAAAGSAVMLALLFNDLTKVEEDLQREVGIVPDSSKLGRFAKNIGLLTIYGAIAYGLWYGWKKYTKTETYKKKGKK